MAAMEADPMAEEEASEEGDDDEAAAAGAPARKVKVTDVPVSETEIMTFLFPPDQQHPSSASRLFLFARYGPLKRGQIVGGSYKRHRPLTTQELNDLIAQDEREELLSLFLDPSVQKALSPAEAAAVITETRSIPHVKNALFNYTTHEVRAFLKYIRNVNDLDEGADIAFGILVNAIEAEHDYRIEQLKHAAAALVLKKKRGTPLQRGLLVKNIRLGQEAIRPKAMRVLKVSNVPLVTDKADLKALIERYGACDGLVIPSDGGGKVGTVYKVMMATEGDADRAIEALHGLKLYGQKLNVEKELLAGQELDNFQIAEQMLHKGAYQMMTVGGESMNDSGTRNNLALLRPLRANRLRMPNGAELPMHDYPMMHDQRQWDALCCIRGQQKSTYVEGAPHYTGGSLGVQPYSVATSRITQLNSSPHVPTVLVTTHRRMGHHYHTEAEQGIHPRKGAKKGASLPNLAKTKSMS